MDDTTLPGVALAQDIRPHDLRVLDVFFAPKTVAVIGGAESEGIERMVLSNLANSRFGGTVFPIHPKQRGLLGFKAYPLIAATPEPIDLAIICSPAPAVPALIGECVAAGVKGAIILSAGFREIGPAGARLEQEILAQARQGALRIVGPNCLGIMNTATGLNATPARHMARRGHVAFISQSGALGEAVLAWSARENIGMSAFVSVGSMLDVGWGELITYLSDEPQTRSILLYMETIGDARSFLSAAREAALTKPVIVLKAGRTESAARAAASHTGALTGGDAVLDAAFRRCGVLRVNSIEDLFSMAEVLEKQPRPAGPRLTIITNAGGPGVLAADALTAQGGELASLPAETSAALDRILPAYWSHTNPIDILDDAGADRYVKALEVATQGTNTDGFLLILTPQACSEPAATAEQLGAATRRLTRPVLASWMGGQEAKAGAAILNRANIPAFAFPDTAARMFGYAWRYTYNLRGIYETPALPPDTQGAPDRALAQELIEQARAAGRTLLSEYESKQILAAYCIPIVETHIATSEDEAVRVANELGYPVVLKLHSETVAHKMDVGGVKLNLVNAGAVRQAYEAIRARGGDHFRGVTVQPMITDAGYELIVGSSIDPQFGPVVLFGAGGQLVDVLDDRALALPPLNATLARRMMEQTRIYRALQGTRGVEPASLEALTHVLVRFSQLVIEQPWIQEIDVNPLFFSNERSLALDARIILFGPETRADELPRPAIRPYPVQYTNEWTTRQGMPVTIRVIRPEDEPAMVAFHKTLSERSVELRYMQILPLSQRVAHERLARICFNDYDRELALVAERTDPETGRPEILAVGRLSKLRRKNEAEFAVVVSDSYQRHGLGTELLKRLVRVARDEKLDRVVGFIATDNIPMLNISRKQGFRLHRSPDEPQIEAILDLEGTKDE